MPTPPWLLQLEFTNVLRTDVLCCRCAEVYLRAVTFAKMISTENSTYSRPQLRAALGKAVLGTAVAIGVLGAGEAQALVVNVNGQNWNVTFFDGTQGGPNAALFRTPAQGGAMPWFTDNAASCGTNINASASTCLAAQFARAVGTQLNGVGNSQNIRFAFSGMTSDSVGLGVAGTACTGSSCLRTGQFITINTTGTPISVGDLELDTEPQDLSARWAYVDPVYPLPVPGPLPALGAAAAFGFSRKLRQRIKVNKSVGASITAG